MPRIQDSATRNQFTRDGIDVTKQRCKHCQTAVTDQQSVMKRNLTRCSVFQAVTASALQQNAAGSQALRAMAQPSLTSGQKAVINKAFVKAIIVGRLSFNTLDSDLFRHAFQLLNASYKPPNRNAIRLTYVSQLYDEYMSKFRAEIDASEEIAIIFDATSSDTDMAQDHTSPSPLWSDRHLTEQLTEEILQGLTSYHSIASAATPYVPNMLTCPLYLT
ncbi:hypothetical protein GGS21DRAFT_493611 [Xylaria nigripes]|nr:hypothetical protein GGS21DRAFT_493611 [Xylaria nigripes]